MHAACATYISNNIPFMMNCVARPLATNPRRCMRWVLPSGGYVAPNLQVVSWRYHRKYTNNGNRAELNEKLFLMCLLMLVETRTVSLGNQGACVVIYKYFSSNIWIMYRIYSSHICITPSLRVQGYVTQVRLHGFPNYCFNLLFLFPEGIVQEAHWTHPEKGPSQ